MDAGRPRPCRWSAERVVRDSRRSSRHHARARRQRVGCARARATRRRTAGQLPVCRSPRQSVEEEFLARRVRRRTGTTRTTTRSPAQKTQKTARARDRDNEGIIPILARAVREVESAAERGPLKPAARVKFQAVALLAREARAAVRADKSTTEARRSSELKRLDGIGTILAKTAARDTSVLALLAEDAHVTDAV